MAREPDEGTERRLWFSILAPAAAWAAAELIGTALVGRSCTPTMPRDAASGTGELSTTLWILAFATPVVAAAVAVTGLVLSLRVFRDWHTSDARITRAEGWNRVEFMAIAGAIISFFLLLNIVYFAVMPMIVDPCLRVT